MKINNDKYYTDLALAEYCINKTFDKIGMHNIGDIIEPSAGNGSFSLQIDDCIAYDIEPEHSTIIKQDYLELDVGYLKNRLVIGNPPFGEKMNLAKRFFEKSVEIADYIAFILPISQLNNTNSLYKFDLIHSEDLGVNSYTDRDLHCCLNIYKRPNGGKLNPRRSTRLKDVEIIRQDSKRFKLVENYDLRMCYWGNGSAGKILKEGENYSAEYKIIVHNPNVKDAVTRTLSTVDWHEELNCIAMLKIQQFHINELLIKNIPNIS